MEAVDEDASVRDGSSTGPGGPDGENPTGPASDAAAPTPTRWFPAGPAPWAVIASGVVLRLAWATVGARTPTALADPGIYLQAARRIAAGDGYVSFRGLPTSYYPPGYPWFLGSLQWVLERVGLGDHSVVAIAVVQSVLSGVAIAGVIVVGMRLGGRRVALLSGLVLALWPNLIVHSSLILSETLFITLLSVSLAATVWMVVDGRLVTWRAIVAAASLGAATLVRPQVLLVAAAVVVGWAICGIGWRDVLRRGAILAVGVVVVVAPWTIRNATVFGALVPVSTNDGDNLCVGFNPEATGAFTMPASCDTGEFYIDGPAAELRRQDETRRRAITFIREHPGEVPALSAKKLWYTFRRDDDGLWASSSFGQDEWLTGTPRRAADVVTEVYYLVVMALALAGAVLAWRRGWRDRVADPTAVVVVLGALASSLVPVLFFGDARFKVGGTPMYAVLAATALAALVSRWRGPDRSAAAAAVPPTPPHGPSTPA